jgi:hypothetical protein
MSVYLDDPIFPYGHMMMCHMVADSIEELHDMADRIGIRRKWFQNKRVPHYDICKSKRVLAIKLGALEVGREKFVEISKRLRNENCPKLPIPTSANFRRMNRK